MMKNNDVEYSSLINHIILIMTMSFLIGFTSAFSDETIKIEFPSESISIVMDKDWEILSTGKRILTQKEELFGQETFTNLQHHKMPFSANYYENGKVIGILNIVAQPQNQLSQKDLLNLTTKDINNLDIAAKEQTIKTSMSSNIQVVSWGGVKRKNINGLEVLVSEYHRKALKSDGVFRVRLLQVFRSANSFMLTVSYKEQNAPLLRPETDRIIKSLTLLQNKQSSNNLQEYLLEDDFNEEDILLDDLEEIDTYKNESLISLFVMIGGLTIIIYFIGTRFINKTKISSIAINIGLLIALFIAMVTAFLLGENEGLTKGDVLISGFVGSIIALIFISLKDHTKGMGSSNDTAIVQDNAKVEIQKNQKSKKGKKPMNKNLIFSRITRAAIVLSLLWEIIIFVDAWTTNRHGRFMYFKVEDFLFQSIPIVIIVGMMWIFGIFRLKP